MINHSYTYVWTYNFGIFLMDWFEYCINYCICRLQQLWTKYSQKHSHLKSTAIGLLLKESATIAFYGEWLWVDKLSKYDVTKSLFGGERWALLRVKDVQRKGKRHQIFSKRGWYFEKAQWQRNSAYLKFHLERLVCKRECRKDCVQSDSDAVLRKWGSFGMDL